MGGEIKTGQLPAGFAAALGGVITDTNPPITKAARPAIIVARWGAGISSISTTNAAYQDTSRYAVFDKTWINTSQYAYYISATGFAMAGTTQCGLKLTHTTNLGVLTELGRVASEELPAPLEVDDWVVAGIAGGFRCATSATPIVAATLNGLSAGLGGIYPSVRCDGTRTFYIYEWAIVGVPI